MKKRQQIIAFIFICYLLPVSILSLFSPEKSWRVMGLGLLFAAAGSLILYLFMQKWEESVEEPSTSFQGAMDERVTELQSAVEEYQSKLRDLQQVLDLQGDEVRNFESEKDQVLTHYQEIKEDYATFKSSAEEELRRKDVLLSEYQETISQQRDVIKKRQEQITELEGKVKELSFEVKTLIDVAKMEEEEKGTQPIESAMDYQVPTNDATQQLHRCIDIAQKITGANHFERGNSRFRDLHMDNYALDLRRLFDTLRSETSYTVFVFSQKDNKLLFVNSQAKHLLGWSPEKFIQHFPEIIKESTHEWNRGISRLANAAESTSRLLMKTPNGNSIVINCNLGIIPTGIFRNHVIGILYDGNQAAQK